MALKVLVAEPDVELARQQKTALEDVPDLELIVKLFHEADAMEETDRLRPDLLVLRHERVGKTGFATVSRLRKLDWFKEVPVIITTSDATTEAIEKHRSGNAPADVYLLLPASRAQLVEAVRSVAPRAQAHQAVETGGTGWDSTGKTIPPFAGAGGGSPTDGTDTLARPGGDTPMPRPQFTGPRAPTSMVAVDPTDLAFVERLFSSLGKLDAMLDGGGDSGDPRVATLREKLRERERDMQRLARLWRAKEQEVRAADNRLHDKESEVEAVQLQVRDLTEALNSAKKAFQDKDKELGASVDGLLTERVMLEKDLIEVVASKEKEIESLKRERRELENAAAALKQELVSRVYEWDSAYRDLDDMLKRTVAQGVAVMDDLCERLDLARVELIRRQEATVEEQRRVAFLRKQREETADLQAQVLSATDRTRRELVHQIDCLEAHARHLGEQLRDERGRADADTLMLECRLAEMQREKAAVHYRLNMAQAWLTQRLVERDAEIARLHGLWTADRVERNALRTRLQQQELAAEQMFFNLDQDLAESRGEAGALAWLRAQEQAAHVKQVDELEARIHALTDDVLARDLKLEEAHTAYQSLAGEKTRAEEAAQAAVAEREVRINELQLSVAEAQARLAASNEKRAGVERTLTSRENTIKELNARIDAQTEELSALQNTAAGHEAQARSLSVQLEERERVLRERDNALATARAEMATAREEMERQTNEINSRDEQVRQKALEIRNQEAAVARKQAEIEELDRVLAHLQNQTTRNEEEKDALKARIKEQTATISAAQGQITKLQGDVAGLTDERAALQRAMEDKQVALEGLEQLLHKADQDAKEHLQQQRAWETQLEAERVEVSRLRGEVSTRDKSLEQHRAKLELAARDRGELEEKLKARSADVAKAEEQLADLRHQLEERQAAHTAMQKEVEERNKRVAHLDGRVQTLLNELEEERQKVAAKQGELEAASAQSASVLHELEVNRVDTRRFEAEVARLSTLVHATEESQTEQFARLESQGRQLADAQAELQRTTEALARSEAALKSTEARLREREELQRTVGNDVEKLQLALAEKTALAADLQRLLGEAEKDQQDKSQTLDRLKTDHEELQEQLFEAKDHIKQLETNVRRNEELAAAAQKREAEHNAELRHVEERAQASIQETQSLMAKLREELSNVRGERDEANFTVTQLTDQIKSLEKGHKEQELARATLGTREQTLNKLNTELRTRMTQLEKANAELTRQSAELTEKIAELQGEIDAGASSRSVEAELRQKAQDDRREAEAVLKERTQELEALTRRAEERQHEIERLEARMEAEKASRAQLEAAMAEQKDQLAKVSAELGVRGSQNAELERSRAQLTVKLSQLERRVQTLQEQAENNASTKELQLGELKTKLTEQVQNYAAEKTELNKRLAEVDAARVRAEGAARQAHDEKENLKRLANRKLQQLTEQLKEAQANVGAAQKANESQTQAAKELEQLRELERRTRLERDAMRRESQTKLGALQARIDRLSRTLTEHGIPVPLMTSEALRSSAPADTNVTQIVSNPFAEPESTEVGDMETTVIKSPH